jgi:hypothetical protein
MLGLGRLGAVGPTVLGDPRVRLVAAIEDQSDKSRDAAVEASSAKSTLREIAESGSPHIRSIVAKSLEDLNVTHGTN